MWKFRFSYLDHGQNYTNFVNDALGAGQVEWVEEENFLTQTERAARVPSVPQGQRVHTIPAPEPVEPVEEGDEEEDNDLSSEDDAPYPKDTATELQPLMGTTEERKTPEAMEVPPPATSPSAVDAATVYVLSSDDSSSYVPPLATVLRAAGLKYKELDLKDVDGPMLQKLRYAVFLVPEVSTTEQNELTGLVQWLWGTQSPRPLEHLNYSIFEFTTGKDTFGACWEEEFQNGAAVAMVPLQQCSADSPAVMREFQTWATAVADAVKDLTMV